MFLIDIRMQIIPIRQSYTTVDAGGKKQFYNLDFSEKPGFFA